MCTQRPANSHWWGAQKRACVQGNPWNLERWCCQVNRLMVLDGLARMNEQHKWFYSLFSWTARRLHGTFVLKEVTE